MKRWQSYEDSCFGCGTGRDVTEGHGSGEEPWEEDGNCVCLGGSCFNVNIRIGAYDRSKGWILSESAPGLPDKATEQQLINTSLNAINKQEKLTKASLPVQNSTRS